MDSRPHRRRILQLASSGLVAWGLGSIAGGCSRGTRNRVEGLGDARRRAREERRPLLVLVADPNGPSERGLQWSAYFDLASDRALAGLSTCELAFASSDHLREELPSVELGTPFPHAVLCSWDGRRIHEIPAVLPEPGWGELRDLDRSEELLPWIDRLERSVDAAMAAAGVAPVPDVREAAESMRGRLRVEAPAGAKWGKDFGTCGDIGFEDGTRIDFEDVPILCGMGFASEEGRRFLWLYSGGRS